MKGRGSALLIVLFLLVALAVFWNRAAVQGRAVNTNMDSTDQSAYMKQAIDQRLTDFAYVNPRNRMPLYPGLLALFMDKGELTALRETHPENREFFRRACAGFFETGKKINTVLAVGLLVFLAVVFLRKFPPHHALNIWTLAAFGVIVFKAPWVQAELLYYFLTFSAFLVCWRLFGRPDFLLAILGGALLGLGHLTKASVLPGVLVFVVFYPLDALWRGFRRTGRGDTANPVGGAPECPRPWGGVLRRVAVAGLVAAAYLAVIGPYILQSKRMFGSYFYNVNSTFYMWCDSWKEAKASTGGEDRKGFPDHIPRDQLPSLSKYLKTHTAGQIVMRPIKGISVVFNSMMRAYGYLGPCLAYLGFAVVVAAWKWRLVRRLISRRPVPLLALLAYFCGYYLLFAWYSPIINGNRFVLGLFLPFLFSVSVVIVRLAPRVRWAWRGRRLPLLTAFNVMMSAWIAWEVAWICFDRIARVYGGG
jgi:hypothetical protein